MRAVLLGPYPLDRQIFIGGVDAVITNLAEGLQNLGELDLHVVATHPGVEKERVIREDGMTVHYLPQSTRLVAPTFYWQDVRRLRAKLDSLRPDIVDAHGTNMYAGAAVASKYPSVVTVHGIVRRDERILPGTRNRLRALLVGYYERRCVAKARDIIAISPYVDREFRWSKSTRIHRIENPIPAKYYAIKDEEIPHTVLFVGRVIRRKGLLELVGAVAQVRAVIPDIRVRIAGEAEVECDYAREVREAIAAEGLEGNIELTGLLDEKRIMEEYSRCSLVVLPSQQETAPMSVQQAMAAGKAVVATRVGGLEYLVDHEVTGLLVDFGDREGLAKAIIEMLTDHARRREMGRKGREAAARFRSDRIAEETCRVFQLVAGRA